MYVYWVERIRHRWREHVRNSVLCLVQQDWMSREMHTSPDKFNSINLLCKFEVIYYVFSVYHAYDHFIWTEHLRCAILWIYLAKEPFKIKTICFSLYWMFGLQAVFSSLSMHFHSQTKLSQFVDRECRPSWKLLMFEFESSHFIETNSWTWW